MKRIIQFWAEGSPPPPIEACMSDWRRLNPDWAYSCFDRATAAAFLDQTDGEAMAAAFLDIRLPAMMADVFRVAYLLHRGGLWVDAGTHCRASLGDWLDSSLPLVLVRRPHMKEGIVCNGLIYAAEPSHPLLAQVWSRMRERLANRCGGNLWRDFGAGLYREVLACGADLGRFEVVQEAELTRMFSFQGTGGLAPDQHWSRRHLTEPLYLSHPFCPLPGVELPPPVG